MKRSKGLLTLAALALVVVAACQKEEEEAPPTPDTTAPTLELVGGPQIDLSLNATYVDPGFSAQDDVDGDLSAQVTVEGTVNVNQVGDYELTYEVVDAAGNASSAARVVTVANDAAFLGGVYTVTANCSGTWSNPSAYSSFVSVSETANNTFTISELYNAWDENAEDVYGMLQGDEIVIPTQDNGDFTVSGSGMLGDGSFEVDLTTGENCDQTFTKD